MQIDLNSQNETQEPSIQFKGQFMLVNGHPVSYEHQSLRASKFFLTSLAIDLPLQPNINTFDEKHFHFMLVRTILQDIQTSHVKVGLQILQHLPKMPQTNYINLLNKLSLNKIREIFMDGDFYLFLWTKLMNLNGYEDFNKQEIKLHLKELNQPWKRILFMVEFLPCSLMLRQALIDTARDLVYKIMENSSFLTSLINITRSSLNSEPENKVQWNTSQRDFLKNIIDSFKTMVLLQHTSLELNQNWIQNTEHFLSSQILTNECLAVICLKFDELFNYDRSNLMQVLSIVALEKGKALWNDIISTKYKKNQSPILSTDSHADLIQSSSAINNQSESSFTDNQASFAILIINNFYEPSQSQWENTLAILQTLVKCNAVESQAVLIRIFLETTRHSLDSSLVELSINFIRNIGEKVKNDKQITLFLLEFLSIINEDILESYKIYQKQSISRPQSMKKRMKFPASQSDLFVSFYRLYTTLLDLNFVNILVQIDCKKALESLLSMTLECRGIVEGARRKFKQKKTSFLLSQQLNQRYSNRLDKTLNSALFKNFSLLNPKVSKTQYFFSFLKKL